MEALRARLAELERAAAEAERGRRELHQAGGSGGGRGSSGERDADHAQEEVALAERRSARAHAALARLGGLGAWALALGDVAPDDHERAAQWPLERTLTALRATPREALATRRGWQTLIGDVETRGRRAPPPPVRQARTSTSAASACRRIPS